MQYFISFKTTSYAGNEIKMIHDTQVIFHETLRPVHTEIDCKYHNDGIHSMQNKVKRNGLVYVDCAHKSE